MPTKTPPSDKHTAHELGHAGVPLGTARVRKGSNAHAPGALPQLQRCEGGGYPP